MINWKTVLLSVLITIVICITFAINSEGYKEQQLRAARIEIYCEALVITTASMSTSGRNSYLTGETRMGDIYSELIEKAKITIDEHCSGYL